MKRVLFMALAIVALACNKPAETSEETELGPTAYANRLKEDPSIVLLDVRTDAELKTGYIEGAKQLDFSNENFAKSLDDLDHEKTYLVYCASGGRSSKALTMMKEKGFKHVTNLKGGINAWRATGLPVTQPE